MLLGVVAFLAGGCIKNDLPYPRIPANITAIMVENEEKPAVIDPQKRTVTLYMSEEADLQHVRLLSYALEPEGAHTSDLTPEMNLVRPLNAVVSLYQDYVWTIRAEQTVERYITSEPQMGQPVIDVPGRRVILYVPEGTDLKRIQIKSLKLGSTASTMVPDLGGKTVDFSQPVKVVVTDYGRESEWTIYVDAVDASVALTQVDAWTRVAWLYANAAEGNDNGFEYRVQGSNEWTKVAVADITSNNGQITACLKHLSPATTYEARAYSGTDVTASQTFTTGTEAQLHNAGFEEWWLDGKVWNPWAESGSPYWDTGNKGAATLGDSNSQPTENTPTGTGYAAQLRSEFKGIGSIGKLAAGNIFTGVYVRTDGTNGVLNFGREFSQRPTRMRVMLKYKNAPISHVGTDVRFKDWKGRPDTCQIYIALTDWTAPYEIRTNPKNQQLFDPEDPHVIAYGSLTYGEDVPDWTQVAIDLKYRSTSRVPKYILVVCSTSKYGDFFVGGTGSELDVDDLVLEYDY